LQHSLSAAADDHRVAIFVLGVDYTAHQGAALLRVQHLERQLFLSAACWHTHGNLRCRRRAGHQQAFDEVPGVRAILPKLQQLAGGKARLQRSLDDQLFVQVAVAQQVTDACGDLSASAAV
jgi:hypothetical protein